ITGASGAIGTSEKGVAPFIECKVYLDAGQTAAAVKAVGTDPVILTLKDRVVTLSDAFFVGRAEPGSDNGLTVRYEARSGRDVLI
ncbi:MAG: hypothetical protein HQL35_16235, partial [Alphaproteobacteria bacterium]|nr:hypothetical protein [Alphaproteobacteria bacterium]